MAAATSANTHSSSATAVCTACRGATLRARRHARALLRCWCVYMARYGTALYDVHNNNNNNNNNSNNNNTGVDIAAGMHEGRWLFLMLLITQTRSQLSNTFSSSTTTTRRAAAATAADETAMSPSSSQQQQQQLLLQAHVHHILVYFTARVTTELLSLAHDQLSGVAAACKDDDNNSSSSRYRRHVTRVCTLPQLSSVRNVLTCRSLYWAAVADQQSTHDMHTCADVSSNNSNNTKASSSSPLLTAHQTAQLRVAARDYWQAVLPAYQMLTYVQSPCSLHEAAAWTSVDGNVATMYSSHRSRSATLAMGEGSDDDDEDDDDEQAAAMLAALRGADDDDVAVRTLPTALYTRTLQCAAAYTRHCCARSRWRVDAPALQLHRQLSLLRGDVLPAHVANANNSNNNTDAKNDSNCARERLFVYLHTHFLPVYDARCFWLLQQPERQHNLSRALRSLHDALHVHVATYAQRVVGVLMSTSTRATAAGATAVTDATTTTTMSDAVTAAAAATAATTDDKDKSDSDAWESDEDVAKATVLHTADTLPSVLSPPPALATAATTTTTTTVSSSSSSNDEHKADEAKDTSWLLLQQQWRHRRLARTCALLLRDEYVMMSLTHSILVLLERRATIHRDDAAVLCAYALPTVSCLAGYALYLAQRQRVCNNSNNNNNNNNSGGGDNNDDNIVYDGGDCADDVVTARVCTCRAHYSLCALIHAGVLTLPWSLAALYAALVRHYRLCAAFDVNDSHASAATATTTTAAQPSLRSVDELCAATARLEADIANNNNSSSSSSTAIDAFHALLVAGEVPTTTLLDQALRRVTAIALPPPLSLLLIVAAHRVCARQFVALRVAFDDARARAADDDDGGGGGRSGYDMHTMRSSSSRGGGDVVGSSGGGSGSLFAHSGASSSSSSGGGGGSASMRCGDGAFCTSQDVVLLRVVMTTVHRLVFAYTTTTTTAQGQSHDNNSSSNNSSSANDTTSSLPPALHDLLRLWMAYVYDLLVVVVPHTDRDERETVVRLPSSWQETHTCVSVFGVTRHCRGWRALRAAPVCASQTDVRVAVATALAELALLPLMDTAAAKSSACALPSVASPSPTTTTAAMTSMRSCATVQDALPCAVLQQLCLLLHVDVVLDESKATTTATTTTTVRQERNNNDDDKDDDRDKDVHITDAHARACIAAAAARVSHSFIGLHGLLALCRRLEQCIVPGSVAAHTRLAALLRTLFALVDAAARSV